MDGFAAARILARERHAAMLARTDGVATAEALILAAEAETGVSCFAVTPQDPLLCGAEAILMRDAFSIFYKDSVPPPVAAFYQAHEFAHLWLDSDETGCPPTDVDFLIDEEQMAAGSHGVEGYSTKERRECRANVFAREFLLPADDAARLFRAGLSPSRIAEERGIPLGLVQHQLARGLLLPDLQPPKAHSGVRPPLDESQRVAAEIATGPVLLEAGPGTGKTRTLIARVEHLLAGGAKPEDILALTFSNKAAEEMRERVAVAAPAEAPAIWMGTFHSFGLEIIRKYGSVIGLSPDVRLTDPGDALLLLEAQLPSLPLDHYLNLYEPTGALRDILSAISRAKDEMVTPDGYVELGRRMLEAAGEDPDARVAAEKAIEVGRIYQVYERLLASEGRLDFGDLINKAIRILADSAEVRRSVQETYRHVLVDEYQDINRASAELLKLIAGDGRGLWVVGDARQSIYRFRGASPRNIREFERDFPGGRRLVLASNYRSQAAIVRLVEAFGAQMTFIAGEAPRWSAERRDGPGAVHMEIAQSLESEADGIARAIEQHRAGGIPYRDQAILCRTHTYLARFASLLEKKGIPVLYLGDLFERSEIRDLLCLLSLVSEPTRGGLLRVATLPEYRVPLGDVRAVLAYARDNDLPPLHVLRTLPSVSDLSATGRAGLERLAAHLDGVAPETHPAPFLLSYLFERSRFLDAHADRSDVAAQQRQLAIYQFIQFALGLPSGSGDPKRRLLQRVRRLAVLNEDRQFSQVPAAAGGLDAVRLITAHASKGLEFPVVFLPALATSAFPLQQPPNRCPPPLGLFDDGLDMGKDAEEACLFFVALSRARNAIYLSRAEAYKSARKASSLLVSIAASLPRRPDGAVTWQADGPPATTIDLLPGLAPRLEAHSAEDLDQYLRCPRQYLYQRLLGLSGARDDEAYVRYHRVVYAVLRWLASAGDQEPAAVQERLDSAWGEIGPHDHPYAAIYRDAAGRAVAAAIERRSSGTQSMDTVWELSRPAGVIRVRPDEVEVCEDRVVVRRVRTGRAPKKIDDDLYSLYRAAAVAAGLNHGIQIQASYLGSGDTRDVPVSDKVMANRLAKYDAAIHGIASGRFPSSPADERDCPRCSQYFLCASLPEGS